MEKKSLKSVKEIMTSIQRLEKSFIDALLKANDNTLQNAEGMIVETPQPNFVFNSTFTNKTSHKSSRLDLTICCPQLIYLT